MRVQVVRFGETWSEPVHRLYEADGTLSVCWLPGLELPIGPLDGGGFDSRADALAFKLGVDCERALHGMIVETVDDIARERAELDRCATVAKPEQLEAEPPEVEYRRRVA